MNCIHIAICDDEQVIREQVRRMIESCNIHCNLTDFATGKDLLAAKQAFDIIILDIQLEGMDGIQTARLLREQGNNSILIFITGIKEYVFDVFDVSAFHFLIKPIDKQTFTAVLMKAAGEVERRNSTLAKRLFIKLKGKCITIHLHDLLYIESKARKVVLHMSQECLEIYATMNDLETQLGDDFYRCHRGFLVNMSFITEYQTNSILLTNGATVYLSKEKYHDFVQTYMRYLRNGGVCFV